MAFTRLFADDEELGKKDDDFRPSNHRHHSSESFPAGTSWLVGPRLRRRRLLILVVAAALVYLFIHNMPGPLGPVAERVDIRDPTRTVNGMTIAQAKAKQAGRQKEQGALGGKASAEKEAADRARKRPEGPPPHPELRSEEIPPILRGSKKTTDHFFDGQLKFYNLPKSLNAIFHTNGHQDKNKNIVFAAANVESASRLIPVACEMAKYNRNHVHFAFLGRDPISMDALKEVNGASKECAVYWHDSRPDESEISTDARMEYSVTSALYHINQYVHPQAYLVDEDDKEERYFVRGMHLHAARVGRSLIQLPPDATQRMMWITRLDHASIAAWDNVYIDILVHVPPGTSGSLIRLLKSIADADYFGARTPHLTIELPPVVEPATQRFLDSFIWPPLPKDGSKHVSKVTLRKRVSTAHLTPLEASIRTVESFYSARPHDSHVLLLSTQTELSPLYYQYLFYNVLEYGYGWYSQGTYDQLHLAGIALDLPSVRLDGKPFKPPSPKEAENSNEDSTEETPFLWQVPNTNAALYFGHKWQEFHSYLAHRIATPPPEPSKKMVSAAFPAFAEPLLELMRARNYYLLFPHLPHDNAIATIHNELASPPEEYMPEPKPADGAPGKPLSSDTLYLEPAEPAEPLHPQHEGPLLATSLVALLPTEGDLPELLTLPSLSWDAFTLKRSIAVEQSNNYANRLRRDIGGCSASYVPRIDPGAFSADDLFCAKPSRSIPNPDQPHDASIVPAAPAAAEKMADAADQPATPTKTYAPVRAGIEAALAQFPEEDIPNAFRAHPTLNAKGRLLEEEKRKAAQKAGADAPDLKVLEQSGLDHDVATPHRKQTAGDEKPAEAPNQKVPGEINKDATMEEIFHAEREKARKQMTGGSSRDGQLSPKKGPGGPERATDEKSPAEKEAAEAVQRDRLNDKAKMAAGIDGDSDEETRAPKVSAEEKEAMRKEAAAHLERHSDGPSKAQKRNKKLTDDIAVAREMAVLASG